MSEQNQKTGWLEDNQGNPSAMRAMSMLSLFTAITFASFVVFSCADDITINEDIRWLITIFLLAAFAPKAVQKFAENKFKQ